MGRHAGSARRRVTLVWCLGVAAASLFAALAWMLAPLEPGALALQFAATPQAFGRVIHAWTPEQLALYRAHLPLDGVLLFCYGAFGYLLAARSSLFLAWPPAARAAARGCLPLAAGFDAVENLLHAWLTAAPRFGVPLPYLAATLCSTLKWLLLCGFALAVAWALAHTRPSSSATGDRA